MRYAQLLNEAIVNRPRHLGLYLKNRIKELDRFIAQNDEARAAIKSNADEGMSLLQSAIRYGTSDYDISGYDLEAINLDRDFGLRRIRQSFQSYLEHGERFRQYCETSLADAESLHERYAAVLAAMASVPKGLTDYGYDHQDETQHDEEYRAAVMLMRAGSTLLAVANGFERLRVDAVAKFGVLAHRSAMSWQPEKYRPPHGETETLYHATLYATEIVADGFAAEKPVERRGLGNFGDQPEISFTHDLEIARNIMRYLKEMWMIQHGHLKAGQILRWMRHEGLDPKLAWNTFGRGAMPPEHEMTPAQVIVFYRYWIAVSKLRVDPVITSPEETLKLLANRALEDIGVVACQVRLDGSEEYLHGEAEFRLPASAVISIKRAL